MFVVPALAGIEVVCGTAFRLKAVLQTKIHSFGGRVSVPEGCLSREGAPILQFVVVRLQNHLDRQGGGDTQQQHPGHCQSVVRMKLHFGQQIAERNA